MTTLKTLTLAAVGGILFAGSAFAEPPTGTHDSSLGTVLTDGDGMTLYAFKMDTATKSNCNGMCADNWPPLMAADGDSATGDYTTLTRDDGSMQWAYKGMPLYTWIKDAKPGDVTGHGFKDAWKAVQP